MSRMLNWEKTFYDTARDLLKDVNDPTHDLLHVERVVKNARWLQSVEGGKWEVILPAAYFHDFVFIEKNDPRRSQASTLSAEAATEYLGRMSYPGQHLNEIAHAIEAHSFSRGMKPETLEAQIVQDADRLDGLGAIGVARCFGLAGRLGREFYSTKDAFCEHREPEDKIFTVDHFYAKLFKTAETLNTPTAREEGQRRAQTMRRYLEELKRECF